MEKRLAPRKVMKNQAMLVDYSAQMSDYTYSFIYYRLHMRQ